MVLNDECAAPYFFWLYSSSDLCPLYRVGRLVFHHMFVVFHMWQVSCKSLLVLTLYFTTLVVKCFRGPLPPSTHFTLGSSFLLHTFQWVWLYFHYLGLYYNITTFGRGLTLPCQTGKHQQSVQIRPPCSPGWCQGCITQNSIYIFGERVYTPPIPDKQDACRPPPPPPGHKTAPASSPVSNSHKTLTDYCVIIVPG